MSQIAAQTILGRLSAWGVDTVFGLPGNGIMEGLRRNSGAIRFILVHHEEAAAFMATAYAKQTGRSGQPHRAPIATTLFKDRIQQLKAS